MHAMVRRAAAAAAAASLLLMAGCAAAAPPSGPISGSFDVGGHELYLECRGQGAPTVVYLHGAIWDPSGGGMGNLSGIGEELEADHRVCAYDRANVGRSGSVAGPISVDATVADLHALLDAAGVEGPYLLLAASFGGLLACAYAGTHPNEVAGMVLLDPVLPDDDLWEKEYAPQEWWLPEDAWEDMTEQIDVYNANAQTRAVLDDMPDVPVTLVATAQIDLPSDFPQEGVDAIRANQQALVDRFAQGEIVSFDVPHYMEPVIPQEIADVVRDVASRIP